MSEASQGGTRIVPRMAVVISDRRPQRAGTALTRHDTVAQRLGGLLARAFAIFQAFGLAEFLEGLAEVGLRLIELGGEVVGRATEVVAALRRRARISGI